MGSKKDTRANVALPAEMRPTLDKAQETSTVQALQVSIKSADSGG